ncbi:MAG: hypothetical protein HY659_02540 [Rhizobiales bacterium]|nr:hypothetical protein [Hyphomicrobiales bacterium]
MKRIVILAALLTISAVVAADAQSSKRSVQRETTGVATVHNPGGPLRAGNRCWVYTDSRGAGFWDACDPLVPTPRGISLRGRSESDIAAIENGSGGGGDGGGGGGGR